MNVFVTGGTGYLGSALISLLIDKKEVLKVVALVKKPERARELAAKLERREKLEFVEGDLRHHKYDLSNVDAVIHLACEHNPFMCEENSGEVIEVNVGGTQRLVEAVRKFRVPYFIFASAYGVYGKQKTMPLSEDLTPRPNTAKFLITFANEVITRSLTDSPTRFAILRLVHMFGVGTLPSRIEEEFTNKFARSACVGGDLTIYGNGNQTVDLIHVRDVCDCIYKLLISSDSAWNETYNIGGGRAVSMNELAEAYVKAALEMGLKAPVKTYIKTKNYIDSKGLASVLLDISKAQEKLGWIPSTSIEEGVRELIQAAFGSHSNC
ncbi:MAG: NAD(P)-dependent oxidoreductase [Deltaproteobacteria bacterium]|nr:NAD(P)-dependent oxidoreductase [Deltaproteobacteria bacterium]